MRAGLVALTAIVMTVVTCAAAAAEATTVLLVRHAEKEASGDSDPELTAAGRAHAEELAAILSDVELDAVYSTPFRRTRDTAAPVAAANHLDVTIVPVGPGLAERLAATILDEHRGGIVLVVGHSNTIGPTIGALGAGAGFELDESEYGDLFVCTIPDQDEPVVLRLKAWLADR